MPLTRTQLLAPQVLSGCCVVLSAPCRSVASESTYNKPRDHLAQRLVRLQIGHSRLAVGGVVFRMQLAQPQPGTVVLRHFDHFTRRVVGSDLPARP